ncbi:unnamed protein product [Rangifer tarandus platyrhynchus]|uniref:Uncharacterized protein n=2 Tax=Rangifer tarandus platyrhynchus TaxID=3082113 RepID=A0AC59Z0N3_RANTA|nr:unnamed protein product [Rangifer tarandus platyrhynchus]
MPLLITLNYGCLFAFLKENKSGYVIALGNLRSLLKQHSSPAPIFSRDQPVKRKNFPQETHSGLVGEGWEERKVVPRGPDLCSRASKHSVDFLVFFGKLTLAIGC